ncbi:TRAP transporter substrate-binding protein [Parasphingorhabdus cellanae]|uniref:TRAP transporter substrate-binding protein n=1 Tax=Parasphingorhabdus cellanae TaxID=2806553 RepID=UPI002174F2B9|nr:TRAP transporter substrate-binding protein [Parasphingorhabdus cellanae]
MDEGKSKFIGVGELGQKRPADRTRRDSLRLLSIGGLAALLLSCSRDTTVNALSLAHSLDEQHPVHLAMEEFRRQLEQLSGGRMQVTIFPNGQLGSERELVELVQIGAVAMTKVSSLSLENFAPDMKVYSLPYLFDDGAHLWRALESDVGQEILGGLSPILLKGIGYYDAGARSFYMTSGPVATPADIRGKTVRVLSSEALVQTIEAFGGAAAPIAFGELYAALQQGVVQGAENNPPSFLSARHFEVCQYFSLDEHVSAPDVVVMSQSIWDRLSVQQQGWVREAMNRSVAFQRELWRRATDSALRDLEANGVKINRPNKAPFRIAVQKLRQSFAGTRVGELASRIEVMAGGRS